MIFLAIAIITWSISFSRHSKSNIIIEQVEYEEYSDFCSVTYSIENHNASMLESFTLQYEVMSKENSSLVCSGRKYFYCNLSENDKEQILVNFYTIQTYDDGTSQRVPYSDMVIKYKIIEVEWADDMLLGLTKYMSFGFALIPFAYFFGKFFFIVFPICVYAYSFLIQNTFLRILTRLLLFLPYILGALWYQFQDPRKKGLEIKHLRVAVDVNGRVVGSYDPETGVVVDKRGRVVVPTNKK